MHIYRSAEIFGLVLFPAQIANSAVVQSLAEVLHGSYNGVAQFILYICDIYAGAIIIESAAPASAAPASAAPASAAPASAAPASSPPLFIPIPGLGHTPGVPAPSTPPRASSGAAPQTPKRKDPRIFMLEHYGVYDFYEANGSGFDLVGPELVSSDGEAAGTPDADSSPPVMLPFERRIIPYNLRPLPSRSFTSDSFPAARYSPAKTNSPPPSPASAAPASAAPASAAPASAAPASVAPASVAPASAAPASAANQPPRLLLHFFLSSSPRHQPPRLLLHFFLSSSPRHQPPGLLLLFLLSSSPCHQLPRLLLLLSSSHHQPRHSNQKKTIPRPLTGLERRYPHHLPSGSSPPLGMMHLGVLASSATCLT